MTGSTNFSKMNVALFLLPLLSLDNHRFKNAHTRDLPNYVRPKIELVEPYVS
jgi:hypothetical protein